MNPIGAGIVDTSDNFLTNRIHSYINRFHHGPLLEKDSLAEHCFYVSRVGYMVGWLLQDYNLQYYSDHKLNPQLIATMGLFHDDPEIIIGDIPGPVKDMFSNSRKVISGWEKESIEHLFKNVPLPLAIHLKSLVNHTLSSHDSDDINLQIMKYSDEVSALSVLHGQVKIGNDHVQPLISRLETNLHNRLLQWGWLKDLHTLYPEFDIGVNHG